MRTDPLINGFFIGVGLGFILATLALYFPVRDFFPEYATIWQFRFVGIVGGVGLVAGFGLEIYQRRKLRAIQNELEEEDMEEEETEEDEVEEKED